MVSHRRVRATPQAAASSMLEFLGELHQMVPAADFGAHLVALTERLVPGVIVGFDEIREDGGYKLSHNLEMDPSEEACYFNVLTRCYDQNPIHSYIRTSKAEPAVRISDLCSKREFQRTELYQEFFRHVGIEAQLHVVIPVASGSASLSLNHRHDFDGELLKMFLLLAPHIALAHGNALHLSALHAALEAKTGIKANEPLSLREAEVLHWIREGKRNREIALILSIAERTVEKHVENILDKLGVETRVAAAAWQAPQVSPVSTRHLRGRVRVLMRRG